MSAQASQKLSNHAADGEASGSDSDAFVDALDSWDIAKESGPNSVSPAPVPLSKSPLPEEIKTKPVRSVHPFTLKLSAAPAQCHSNPTREERFIHTPQRKPPVPVPHSSGKSASQFAGGFATKGTTTSTTERMKGSAKSSRQKMPEMFHTPDPSPVPVLGVIPPQPFSKFIPSPTPTPKPRTRVPPIAVVNTSRYKKEAQDFGRLTLQQEFRAGSRPIWVSSLILSVFV